MKSYNETQIRKAEILQLILLYHLYAQDGSHELIFQGGTALRWCYGGSRFSEDLDFVTTLAPSVLDRLAHKALKGADSALREAIESDLSRFLPPEVMAVHRADDYRELLDAVRDLCRELIGMRIPSP